jgi:hypothetical protein
LHGVDHPAELHEPRADQGIIDLAKIAGQQLVGHPEPGRDRVQARPLVLGIASCGRGLVEADVLAAARIGDQPRLELLDPVAISIHHGGRDTLLRLVIAKDDGSDASLGLLADQLCHLVIVEIAQATDHGRTPGNAARLCALLLVDMGDLTRRDRAALQPVLHNPIGVARMFGM